MNRKGQGAMEYLMTYGWAILVVMVVGIVMWQLGIFNIGGVTGTTTTGFPRIKPQLALISMDTTGAFSATFTNGAGGAVNVDTWQMKSGTLTCTETDFGTELVSPGDFVHLAASCPAPGSVGDPYSVTMTLTYDVRVGGETVGKTDQGQVRGPIEA